ncbi:MAG: hypothetical protein ACKVS6_15225 [Planctomycetota bacterium]
MNPSISHSRLAALASLLILTSCKSAETNQTLPSGVKEIPLEVRKEITSRLEKYSSQVDTLERREREADKLTDPQARLAEYEELSDQYGVCREGIGDVLSAPEYKLYREDPDYGIFWKGYENRLRYWQAKMNSIKKKRDATFLEIQAMKQKQGECA